MPESPNLVQFVASTIAPLAALDLPPQLQPLHCQAYFPTRTVELLVSRVATLQQSMFLLSTNFTIQWKNTTRLLNKYWSTSAF
jgi:hypothetical protein